MADTEAAVVPATKEKKKKKSVKSSEKSSKAEKAAAAAAAASPAPDGAAPAEQAAPQQKEEGAFNGAATANGVNGEAEAEESTKKRTKPKFNIAADVSITESEPTEAASQQEGEAPTSSSAKPRPKFSWSVQADDVPSEEQADLAVQMQIPARKSGTPEPQPRHRDKTEILKDIDEETLRELGEAFLLLDFNQDGLIDKKDLQLTYATLGRVDVSDSEVQRMLDEAESPMDFEAFVHLLGYKTIELDPEETLLEALAKWDYEGSGLISEERIRNDLMTWGDKFTPQEVDWALEAAPLYAQNDVTMIDYIQFCKTLCGLRKKTSN